jgi:type I restriction enzyme R subunit
MERTTTPQVQVFDPSQEYAVVTRRLPHWSQAGTLCFITFRTWDSIPKSVLQRWLAERDAWLKRHGIDPKSGILRRHLEELQHDKRRDFQIQLSDRWNEHLDDCYGSCALRQSKISEIVSQSLLHFDGDRYDLTDYVIMPNHLHLLVAFPDENSMLHQCDSWKHYTATRINKLLCRSGRFWQHDGFDHLIRSVDQFEYLRNYIARNPQLANLEPGEYVHFSRKL